MTYVAQCLLDGNGEPYRARDAFDLANHLRAAHPELESDRCATCNREVCVALDSVHDFGIREGVKVRTACSAYGCGCKRYTPIRNGAAT
jgi:hypothetical protein